MDTHYEDQMLIWCGDDVRDHVKLWSARTQQLDTHNKRNQIVELIKSRKKRNVIVWLFQSNRFMNSIGKSTLLLLQWNHLNKSAILVRRELNWNEGQIVKMRITEDENWFQLDTEHGHARNQFLSLLENVPINVCTIKERSIKMFQQNYWYFFCLLILLVHFIGEVNEKGYSFFFCIFLKIVSECVFGIDIIRRIASGSKTMWILGWFGFCNYSVFFIVCFSNLL